jgi:hypothetical protein
MPQNVAQIAAYLKFDMGQLGNACRTRAAEWTSAASASSRRGDHRLKAMYLMLAQQWLEIAEIGDAVDQERELLCLNGNPDRKRCRPIGEAADAISARRNWQEGRHPHCHFRGLTAVVETGLLSRATPWLASRRQRPPSSAPRAPASGEQ